jgi:hypothetical protein
MALLRSGWGVVMENEKFGVADMLTTLGSRGRADRRTRRTGPSIELMTNWIRKGSHNGSCRNRKENQELGSIEANICIQ